MYTIDERSHSWSMTLRELKSGEIKRQLNERSTLVTNGAFVIDCINTGWFVTGHSRTVSADVDKHVALLQKGRHPIQKLQKLYDREPELRFIEIPAQDVRTAKRIEARIRASNTTDYCLLN